MQNLRYKETLRRPRILVSAARIGLESFNRNRDLKRLLQSTKLPAPGSAVGQIIDIESHMEQSRRACAADYRPQRHILAVTALLAEQRLDQKRKGRLGPPNQPKASGSLALRSAT